MSIYSQTPQHAPEKKTFLLYSHNAVLTPNKIANSFLSSISQSIFKFPRLSKKIILRAECISIRIQTTPYFLIALGYVCELSFNTF